MLGNKFEPHSFNINPRELKFCYTIKNLIAHATVFFFLISGLVISSKMKESENLEKDSDHDFSLLQIPFGTKKMSSCLNMFSMKRINTNCLTLCMKQGGCLQ